MLSRGRVVSMSKPVPQRADPAQHQRFLDLAAELEADGEGLEDAVRKVAAAKREPAQLKAKRASKARTKIVRG